MKECPKCRLLFADDDLRFCRFDGSSLISEATPLQEAATILFTTGHLDERFASLEKLRHRNGSGKLYE